MLKSPQNKGTLFQTNNIHWLGCILFCVLSGGVYWHIGYEWVRSQAGLLIVGFGVLFLAYSLIITQEWSKVWLKRWLWIAVGMRLLFLFSIPILSDDYFRFVWDGRLLCAGYNPYLYLPSEIIHSPIAVEAQLNSFLFEGLNSPQYFTVYPPLNQFIFVISAWLSQNNLLFNVVLLRFFIILAEIGTIWMMTKPNTLVPSLLPKKNNGVLIYALNPLVIVELTGNLHFEAVTLFFTLLAIRWLNRPLQRDKYAIASAVMLGLGTAVKLIPLIFLPFIMKRRGLWKGIIYASVVGGVLLILFAPFLSQALFLNFGKSLDLYFQKFEFNASFYYLLRALGYWVTGYNVIQILGPFLSILTLSYVVWLTFQRKSLLEKMLLALTLYFLMATTVHPWYITTLVALGCLTKRWYPVVWSALLPLTYVAYASQPYHENLLIVALEYTLVLGCLGYELIFRTKQN